MAIDPVLEKDPSRQALCSSHIFQAIRRLAYAVKRAGHLPLGRWVKESQLLFRLYVSQCPDCEIRCVYKNIRLTGMIEIYYNSIIQYMLPGSNLDGLVSRMVKYTKIADFEYQLVFFDNILCNNSSAILATVCINLNYTNLPIFFSLYNRRYARHIPS